MTTRSTRQINNRPRNILRPPQPLIWTLVLQSLQPALLLDQPRRHLRREEPGRKRIAEDMPRTEFDSEVPG